MPKHLTKDQVRHFREEGWLAPLRAMSAEDALKCRDGVETLERQVGREANAFMKIKGYLASPWIVELARRPEILDAVEDIIGPDIMLFGASIFAKGGRDSRYVSWHQDSAYFGLSPHEEITAWVAFTESTVDNGCLRVVPRTHTGPDREHVETYAPDNMLARGQELQGIDESQAVDLVLKPGEFSLHHERTAHGSSANRTGDRRIGLAFFYIPAHVGSTIGRRTATLVRGVDRFNHWDPDPLPQTELDPVAFKALEAAWGQYKDGEVRQAANEPTTA
ncbi:phytanoyl-CoA dioxygenase [Skermanella stibiiresistens SB22]|uniref:Phytanoyl-CoA dioxygenase n=1 Tax=Skermanella stibiiresistens SB22 TaxID=1385369 RepID=W9GZY1_9PROT|nr:phytanoyl-CoA dioxygenase family protein [Skermanella stibiiresistens]EWY38022.1 phytanoyl-CoA dioxygenase [Skermanella stibiiresistens SB22]